MFMKVAIKNPINPMISIPIIEALAMVLNSSFVGFLVTFHTLAHLKTKLFKFSRKFIFQYLEGFFYVFKTCYLKISQRT